jgi:large conductance mechanosensitive channel
MVVKDFILGHYLIINMSFIQDFKSFAVKGNIIDLAVGVVIGGAFGKIVTSIVNDVIMPPIGLVIGGINFKDLKIVLSSKSDGSPAAIFAYGNFIQTVVEFLIIALAVFMMVRLLQRLQRKEAVKPTLPPPPPTPEAVLLTEIRDLLKK